MTMASLAEPRVHPRRRPLLTPPPSLSPPEGHFRIKKGETFHSPTSPPSKERDPVMAVRLTPRRSPTCPGTLKAIAAGEQRMANILDNFDLNSIGSSSPSSTSGSSYSPHSDYDLPVPRGFLEANASFKPTPAPETSNKRPMMESRPNSPPAKRRQHEHLSDSGLGTSISDNQGISADKGMAKVQDGQLSVHGLESGVLSTKAAQAQVTQSAITSSISALDSNLSETRQLSPTACKQIETYVLQPLLKEESLKPFHPLVQSISQRIANKEIVFLRDLEKTLLWLAPRFTTSKRLYIHFCDSAIEHLHTSTYHISHLEHRKPTERPYTNGYFLDLMQQVRQHAAMITASRNNIQNKGKPAQPSRVPKISTRAEPVPSAPTIDIPDCDSPTSLPQDAEAIQAVARRSMARRRKGEPPMDVKQQCPWCKRWFKRWCDITLVPPPISSNAALIPNSKHVKTHTRPWKCEYGCNGGWPTRKELERHYNDRHAKEPEMYECLWESCPYATKRLSNCKQHMEKAHGWNYVRTKSNGRGAAKSAAQGSAQPTVQPTVRTKSSGQGTRKPTAQPSVQSSIPSSIPSPTQSSVQSSVQPSVQPPVQAAVQQPTIQAFQHTPQSSSMATPSSGSASLSTPPTDLSPSPYLDMGLDWTGLEPQGFDSGMTGDFGLQSFDNGFAPNMDLQNFGNTFNSNMDLQSFGNGFNFDFGSFDNGFTPNMDLQSFDNEFVSLDPSQPSPSSSVETGALHAYSCDPLISASHYPSFGYY